MLSLTSWLPSSPVGWIAFVAIGLIAFLAIASVIAGLVSFGYAFFFAPRFLFKRQPLSAPYANQKPPPRLFIAMCREIWTAMLFYATFMGWPFIRGRNLTPGQGVTPIILVHGYAVSRTSWYSFMGMLEERGVRRPMYALAFNWLAPVERSSHTLARLIDRALEEQGATHVDIVSHSWGGFLSRWYIEKLGHADRVRRLIMMATPLRGSWMVLLGFGAPRREMFVDCPTVRALKTAPPSPPYATLWTECDEIVVPPQHSLLLDPDGNPVVSKRFSAMGHLTMQRDPAVADEVVRLLTVDEWPGIGGASTDGKGSR